MEGRVGDWNLAQVVEVARDIASTRPHEEKAGLLPTTGLVIARDSCRVDGRAKPPPAGRIDRACVGDPFSPNQLMSVGEVTRTFSGKILAP